MVRVSLQRPHQSAPKCYEAPQGQLEAQSRDQGQDEIVRLLLAANAPVEVAPDGNMPLHIACMASALSEMNMSHL